MPFERDIIALEEPPVCILSVLEVYSENGSTFLQNTETTKLHGVIYRNTVNAFLIVGER
jgi:hypothetical protein